VIDRFEGDYAVLFINGSNTPINVLRRELSEGVHEGDHLKVQLRDREIIQAEVERQATEEVRRRIQAKLDRLRRGEHLSESDSK
jgi:hypothetical protein